MNIINKDFSVTICSSEKDYLEIVAIHVDIVRSNEKLSKLRQEINIYKMEGFHIIPLENGGNYWYYDYPRALVYCVILGFWG